MVSKVRRLITELARRGSKSRQSPQKIVVELDDLSSPAPPTFTTVMLKLSPWQEREEPSVFLPITEGNVGFYGHKRIAKASSAFITNMFGCPEESLLSRVFLQPSLPYFIAFIIHQTHVPYSVLSTAHVLLQRYQAQIPPGFDSSKLTAHRLFLSSIIYAVREYWPENEKVFNNDIWSQMSNFTARDIGMMLDHFYDKLDGEVGFSSTVFGAIIDIKEKPIIILEYHHGAYPSKFNLGRTLKTKVFFIFNWKK